MKKILVRHFIMLLRIDGFSDFLNFMHMHVDLSLQNAP
jgi:hypothetical protein